MRGDSLEYIAHINGTGDIQSVAEHSHNVAETAKSFGEKIGCPNFCRLEGILHDIGKLCKDFNLYITGKSSFGRGDIDHSYAGAKYITERISDTDNGWLKEAAESAARAVISHHGLHDWINSSCEDYFKERISKNERYDEISANASALISDSSLHELLCAAAQETEAVEKKIADLPKIKCEKPVTALCFYIGLLERMNESVLMDADRSDTADFMSGTVGETVFDTEKVFSEMKDKMEQKCAEFRKRTDAISKRRTDISERCKNAAEAEVGIVRLIVPTGGGKTLSSLRFAVNYCLNHKKEKIFYIAPYMSILEQNSDVIKEIAGEENVLEHYSDYGASIDDREEYSEYELHAERWDKPVVSTTLVQFLNTLFLGKGSNVRRMHRLCNSVIIIDEVQSLPAKCVYMFNLAINFLAKICGCTVVLCSATQPTFEKCEYPILLDDKESLSGDYNEDFEVFKRTELIDKTKGYGFSYNEAAEFCFERFEENGSLLLILNTKKAALEMHSRLSEMGSSSPQSPEVIHLSTNMCPQHRRECIAGLRERLKSQTPVICVTTQLIEAGVDISFKCVVRSLAGLDNAAQAAGRCNRNGEYDCRPVYMIRINEESLKNLHDIKSAQAASTEFLYGKEGCELLHPESLSEYFDIYYREEKKNLAFPVTDMEASTTLLELLSINSVRAKGGINLHRQAFATAGAKFEVIDSNSRAIIVPYNDEARDLIARLNSSLSPNEAAASLRKAQKYTVSVYDRILKKLKEKEAVYTINDIAVTVLKEGFYDESYGINTEGEIENLII